MTSAGLQPPFPKSLGRTKRDLYLFWMSEARSKPLPFTGWIASCLSHFKSNHQMRIKQGLEISYEKGAVAVVPYKSFFPFPFSSLQCLSHTAGLNPPLPSFDRKARVHCANTVTAETLPGSHYSFISISRTVKKPSSALSIPLNESTNTVRGK